MRRTAESELEVSLAHKTMVVRAAVNEFCDAYNAPKNVSEMLGLIAKWLFTLNAPDLLF